MQHDIRVEGSGFALRPIQLDDAALIVALREDVQRARFLNPIAATVEAQRAYLANYLERADDYYFVVERLPRYGRGPEGLISLYDVNGRHSAEWGRWIIRRGSLAATESVQLLYRVAFERLALQEIYCRTLIENTDSLSFHDGFGLRRRRELTLPGPAGEVWPAVEHVLTREEWPPVNAELAARAERVASHLDAS